MPENASKCVRQPNSGPLRRKVFGIACHQLPAVDAGVMVAASDNGAVYVSTTAGRTWTLRNVIVGGRGQRVEPRGHVR